MRKERSTSKLLRSGMMMVLILLLSLQAVRPVLAAPPSAPSVITGAEIITISNYVSGATLKVYKADTNEVVWQEANVTTATKTLDLLPYSKSYYVTQTVGVEQSTNTPFFNTSLRTPLATPGIRFIDVTNVSGNTTLELHRVSNGSLVSTTVSNQGGGVYRFQNVIPDSSLYYIVQTHSDQTSNNTPFLTSRLNTPIATGGAEYVDVTNVDTDIGASLRLYNSDGTLASNSSINQGNGTYRFSNVPVASGYYVTQSVNGVQESSNQVNVAPDLPNPPVITAGYESIEVSSIIPGATLTLYNTQGTFIDEYVNVSSSTFTIENLVPNTIGYYVKQTVNGKTSVNSNFANPTLHVPTATAGVGYIDVNNVTNGANLKLYNAGNGQLVSSTTVDQGNGVYRFENVVPLEKYYYVTQSLGGRESSNTPFVNSMLPTPVIIAGVDYVEVSSTYAGATIVLYSGATPLSSTPQSLGNGIYRFNDLDVETPYYVVQSINNVPSQPSNIVQIAKVLPLAPVVAGMDESIQVSGYTSGATLKLYLANGTEIQTFPNVTGSVYTMENVLPDQQYYYVTQVVNGDESENSLFVNSTLRIPIAIAGVESINVSHVSSSSQLKLYDADRDTVVSQTYTMLDDGTYRFENIAPLQGSYYVTQSVNGIESVNSLFVNPILRTPTAKGGQEFLDVDNVYPGATLKLFRSGTAQPRAIEPTNLGEGKYRFNGISSQGNYYVVQYVNDVASPRSNTVSVTVRENASVPVTNEPSTTPVVTPTPDAQPVSVDVLVNGQIQKAGTLTESVQEGRKVQTILVNPQLVRSVLAAAGKGATVTVPFTNIGDTDKLVSQWNSELIGEMIKQKVILVLDTPLGKYRLPASQLAGASGSGADFANAQIDISIAKALATDSTKINDLAAKNRLTVLQPSVSFEIEKTVNSNRTIINRFNQYVERMIPLLPSINTNATITGVVLSGNELVPVPTRVMEQNNQKYAVISNLTNSTYALVKSEAKLQDINGSWAASSIANMAARWVIEGTGNGQFEPARSITRAEFASILTKALGLKPNAAGSSFADVASSAWYSEALSTATEYELITGFADGTFRPQQQITRAEAMVMLSRAMQLTRLQPQNNDSETVLKSFVDANNLPVWARSAAADTIAAGLFNGQSGKQLAPQKWVTRAEVATLVERLLRESGLI
ncbi:S-layer homology domain-containing protein [Saccharibacillus sp. JS10]|uniref:S-layer homology domain-containing protein n=1 Tax=Saccharibacillus sp. JS10 TaxID=2950552 RepID=UPI00210B650C|nr:S-layer homology domain-containing protein [Saccharibacillus sp. JS10]MCQ4088597.1 S-layer homology domain-containing protein [Saccharibacillus sp. JS10]